ncbi:MAG TPA: 50S ribosomal protein L7Ae [archaeon]|nr:50S ribosomal protein L7Ae [archaeon]
MMPKAYVKFDTPKELNDKILQLLEAAKNNGKLRRGTNETTKAVEKSQAQLVVMAEDVEPEEILMHLPVICEEKKIPYCYVSSKQELGRASGIDVPSAAIGIVDAGDGKDLMKDVLKMLQAIKK